MSDPIPPTPPMPIKKRDFGVQLPPLIGTANDIKGVENLIKKLLVDETIKSSTPLNVRMLTTKNHLDSKISAYIKQKLSRSDVDSESMRIIKDKAAALGQNINIDWLDLPPKLPTEPTDELKPPPEPHELIPKRKPLPQGISHAPSSISKGPPEPPPPLPKDLNAPPPPATSLPGRKPRPTNMKPKPQKRI